MKPKKLNTDLPALLFAMVFPTLVTLVYFQWLQGSESSLQQVAFGLGKVLQFGFPATYVWLFHREKFGRPAEQTQQTNLRATSLWYAIGFGLLVAVAMFAIYFLLIDGTSVAENLQVMVAEKINSLSVNTLPKYVALVCFYAIVHSFMEEYYWRWFVFNFLKKFVNTPVANGLSGLGFMAHHVVVLGFFFGWNSPWTYLVSFSVAVGGFFWAWLFDRTGSLRSPWISHAIVDAAIFSLGYFLLRGVVFV